MILFGMGGVCPVEPSPAHRRQDDAAVPLPPAGRAPVPPLLDLQRAAGNRAVAQLVAGRVPVVQRAAGESRAGQAADSTTPLEPRPMKFEFNSAGEAAFEILKFVNPRRTEHAGWIVARMINGRTKYAYTTPVASVSEGSVHMPRPPSDPELIVVADYHTHGSERSPSYEKFSLADKLSNLGLIGGPVRTGYLMTPEGRVLRYNPNTFTAERLSRGKKGSSWIPIEGPLAPVKKSPK